MEWSEALEKSLEASESAEGFYVTKTARSDRVSAVLCLLAGRPARARPRERDLLYRIYR